MKLVLIFALIGAAFALPANLPYLEFDNDGLDRPVSPDDRKILNFRILNSQFK